MKFKNIVKYLPLGSGIAYEERQRNKPVAERDNEIKKGLKLWGHNIYTMVSPFLLFYLSVGIGTGLWTPKQYDQSIEENRQKKEYRQKLIDGKFEFYKKNNLTNSR